MPSIATVASSGAGVFLLLLEVRDEGLALRGQVPLDSSMAATGSTTLSRPSIGAMFASGGYALSGGVVPTSRTIPAGSPIFADADSDTPLGTVSESFVATALPTARPERFALHGMRRGSNPEELLVLNWQGMHDAYGARGRHILYVTLPAPSSR